MAHKALTDLQYRNRIAKINALKAQAAELTKQVNALQDELKAAMGDAEKYTTEDGWNVFWRWKKGADKFDTARFQEEHPELVPKYMTTGKATREFRITRPGKATA